MALTEAQLLTWSNLGATASSVTTYNSVKTAIDGIGWADIVSYDIYLQGSYRNTTNIRGDSDVDVVAQLTSIFQYDISSLQATQSAAFQEAYPKDAEFTLDAFRTVTFEGLQEYYGNENVTLGGKAIDINGTNGRLHADVLCCLEYRKYNSFSQANRDDYISGIKFYSTTENRWIINYPKLHYDNGVNKNRQERTSQNYKPVTRIFKNIRTYLVNNNLLPQETAPSYFIQCLLYNVPDASFQGQTYRTIMYQILTALTHSIRNAELGNFICQNGMVNLFGDTHEQWNRGDAIAFINAVIQLYN